MKQALLLAAYREALNESQKVQTNTIAGVNKLLKGKDVKLLRGKYKGRLAQIQDYYFDHGKEYLHVYIYSMRGREQFIDAPAREFLEFKDCELM